MSTELTREERLARLEQYIAEGRLVRGRWRGMRDGRELACLLSALSPEAGEAGRSDACPAWLLPPWFADLTVWINDAGTEERWPEFVRRYAAAIRVERSPDEWQRLYHRFMIIVITEARSHTQDAAALESCERVIALHRRAIDGDAPTADEWRAATVVAEAARHAALPLDVEWAAVVVTRAAVSVAWAAAEAAAAAAARAAAPQRYADRMIDAFLNEMGA